jgi:acyl carrier protein
MMSASGSSSDLRSVVRDTLEVVLGRPIPADDRLPREENPDWDSLKHIEVVFALEGALGITFDADELGDLTGIDSIVAAAERHGAA